MIAYSMGRRSSACERRRATRRADPGATSSLARHRRVGQSGLDALSGAEDFLPADLGQPFIQGAGVELVRRGLTACGEDPRSEPRLGHPDRLVVCEQKSADMKRERALVDLKPLGGFFSCRGAFRAERGVGGAKAAPAHILGEACEFVDRLLDLWRKHNRTATGLPPDQSLLP